MSEEQWRPVVGYEGCYEVSNLGRVRSVDRVRPLRSRSGKATKKVFYGKVLYQAPNNSGYLLTYLCIHCKKKACTVHRLVAQAWLDNPEGWPEVNHINGDKFDNRVSNLEWCTISYNKLHAYKTGLRQKKVKPNERD